MSVSEWQITPGHNRTNKDLQEDAETAARGIVSRHFLHGLL